MNIRKAQVQPAQGTGRIAIASLVGTTIEFYDFYIYSTAAALVVGPMFFPAASPSSQALNAFLTFGIAFLARPLGSALFGHFGDRIGRKATLVASLLVMGVSTTLIGLLPGYDVLGTAAAIILCVLRVGQGIGIGGEWGGAALVATENAPPDRKAWFGMFPRLGPSIGFLLANGLFLLLFSTLSSEQFMNWGWRLPFLASAVLVVVGLYVRMALAETPAFARAMAIKRPLPVPLATLIRKHWRPLLQGSLSIVVCYTLFYISTVFALSYGVLTLHIPKDSFLLMLCIAILFMALATPISARASAILAPRVAYNLGGILGASLAPYIAQRLVIVGGLAWVGYYLSMAAVISFVSVLTTRETRGQNLSDFDLQKD